MNDQELDNLLRTHLVSEPKQVLQSGLAQRVMNYATHEPKLKGLHWLTLYWNAYPLLAGLLIFALPWPVFFQWVPFFALPALLAFTLNANLNLDSR